MPYFSPNLLTNLNKNKYLIAFLLCLPKHKMQHLTDFDYYYYKFNFITSFSALSLRNLPYPS